MRSYSASPNLKFTSSIKDVIQSPMHLTWKNRSVNLIFSPFIGLKRNIEDGAMTSLVAALDNKYDGQTALYFKDCKPANPSALAR